MTESREMSAEAFAAMAAPGAEHELLRPFVGTFRAEVRLWMGPGDPQISTGEMTNTLELGGKFLCQSYEGDPGDTPFPDFEGRGFWGFNKVDSVWEGVWIDTASTVMQTERGTVDTAGRVWTMEGRLTNPQDGSSLRKRSVITLVDEDHHLMEMYFETPGGNAKGMEIRYERSG